MLPLNLSHMYHAVSDISTGRNCDQFNLSQCSVPITWGFAANRDAPAEIHEPYKHGKTHVKGE
jgi:hypothetical protein